MFFSYERNLREHRFWIALNKDKADILSFKTKWEGSTLEEVNEVNKLRKQELFELSYDSSFRIGLATFYSMPSPASGYPWAGVEGIRKLFDREAFARITKRETERINQIIKKFVHPDGAVIVFQKDAYQAIKLLGDSDYTRKEARAGKLLDGHCQCSPQIRLFCLPPTYEILWKESKKLLNTIVENKNWISCKNNQ